MKNILLFVLTGISVSLFAQKPDAYGKTITPADLKKHLYIVAGPQMEGRETGTEGERKAAQYLVEQFRAIGLQPGNGESFLMPFPVYQDSLLGAQIEVNGTEYKLDQDFSVNIGANVQSTLRFSEIVVAGMESVDSLQKMNLAGKAVLLTGNTNARARIYTVLQEKGVAALLMTSPAFPRNAPTNRRGQQSVNAFRKMIVPQQYLVSENLAKAITGEAWGTIKDDKAGVRVMPSRVLLYLTKITNTIPSANVIAMVPGSDLKDEYLFITAHYDHLGKRGEAIYYGADDDGSGTVSLLEIAEAFMKAKKEGKGPRRNVVFMAVSGEEKGLWGSEFYASYPIFPLNKTTADLNIDMIGRSDATRKVGDSTNYVYVVGDDKLSSDLRKISEAANKSSTRLELDYKFNDAKDPNRIYYRSDHYNFAKNGVPIIFYYDGMLGADYHRATDTPDKINYELLAKRARLVFHTAWEMANRAEMLKRDIPLDQSVYTR